MSALVIAIGNRLRADDGVAHHLADLVHDATLLRVHQLTPELAADLDHHDPVIFLDADPATEGPSLERIHPPRETTAALSHSMNPETLVAIATRLYGFQGEAWICGLYARDFSASTELSPQAAAQLGQAAHLVQQLLEARCTNPR